MDSGRILTDWYFNYLSWVFRFAKLYPQLAVPIFFPSLAWNLVSNRAFYIWLMIVYQTISEGKIWLIKYVVIITPGQHVCLNQPSSIKATFEKLPTLQILKYLLCPYQNGRSLELLSPVSQTSRSFAPKLLSFSVFSFTHESLFFLMPSLYLLLSLWSCPQLQTLWF